jgi:hypothetical protein
MLYRPVNIAAWWSEMFHFFPIKASLLLCDAIGLFENKIQFENMFCRPGKKCLLAGWVVRFPMQ